MSLFEEKGVGLVMTDLFVSATAALLIVLAVARTSPPVPLPVQADVIATCITNEDGTTFFEVSKSEGPPEMSYQAQSSAEFAQSVVLLNLTPALFHTVAILPQVDRPLSAECISEFTVRIVREHNRAASTAEFSQDAARTIFSVIASPTPTEGDGTE